MRPASTSVMPKCNLTIPSLREFVVYSSVTYLIVLNRPSSEPQRPSENPVHHIQPRLASLLLVLISSTSALAAGEGILPLLIGPQQPPFGPSGILGPAQVATGDFNRDGKTDLVVLETTTGQVRVFNGDGAGSFTMPGRIYPVSHPYAVTVTDFDGDGNLDIAITSYVENCVTILLGDGAGNFTRPSWGTLETGRRPLAIASADFNGDSSPDLAVSNFDDGSVTILLWSASAGRFHQAAGGAFRVGTERISTGGRGLRWRWSRRSGDR